MASATFPPCARHAFEDGKIRTFVAKTTGLSQVGVEWATIQAHASQGANAVAIVALEEDKSGAIYIVLTRPAVFARNYEPALKRTLEQPPLSAKVEWVQPLTRRLQRLFEWGDVWMDAERLQQAIEEEDTATLRKVMPEQRLAIEIGDYSRVAVASTALLASSGSSGLLALGPSSSAALGDNGDYEESEEEKRKARLRSEHDAGGTHSFGDPSMKWECALCNAFPAARCAGCGAQRCKKCGSGGATRPRHRVVWRQNALNPAPFFVHNPAKLSNEQQVEWIRDEAGAGAPLEEFAQVYLQLFGEKMKGELQRRLHCLELYGLYNKAFKARKECQLEPSLLEAFQRVFNPKAPARCRWCSAAVEPGGPYAVYCSNKCHAAAHPPSKCPKCGHEEHLVVPNVFRLYQLDRWGAPSEGLAKCKRCRHLWECDVSPMSYDPRTVRRPPAGEEPAYKSRRRS